MDIIQVAFLPLGAFWIALKTLLDTAGFANNMRELIVTGYQGTNQLGLKHRKAIFVDWCLTMMGAIVAAFVFSVLMILIANYITIDSTVSNASNLEKASYALVLVGITVFLCGVFFIICGVSDFKLIHATLSNASLKRISRHSSK